jgi:hypothetical protein
MQAWRLLCRLCRPDSRSEISDAIVTLEENFKIPELSGRIDADAPGLGSEVRRRLYRQRHEHRGYMSMWE